MVAAAVQVGGCQDAEFAAWDVAKCFDKTSPAARALRLLYGDETSAKSVGNQYSDHNRVVLRRQQLSRGTSRSSVTGAQTSCFHPSSMQMVMCVVEMGLGMLLPPLLFSSYQHAGSCCRGEQASAALNGKHTTRRTDTSSCILG